MTVRFVDSAEKRSTGGCGSTLRGHQANDGSEKRA